MAPKVKVPGRKADVKEKADMLARPAGRKLPPLPLIISVQEVVDVASAREAGGAVTVELAVPAAKEAARTVGQVFEVELEGGITLWLRPDSLHRDFGVPKARGAAKAEEKGVWEIAPTLSRRVAARGASADLPIRRMTVYRVERPLEPVATAKGKGKGRGAVADAAIGLALDAAAGKIADRFAGSVGRTVERHLLDGNEPGLYQIAMENDLAMKPVDGFAANGPILLFLHGTMSSFGGSYGRLWDGQNAAGADARLRFSQRYGHAYAWEHYTLTESPIANALALAEKLPDNARLHLVSHSRGGLVGDLLCLGQRVAGDEPLSLNRIREIFELAAGVGDIADKDDPRKKQAEQLVSLIEILEKKKVTVERFVRVACPARGTTLASGKLDRWLSVVKALNDLVLPFNFPLQLLIALIAEHDDPARLPGLEAMMPGSPLVRLLNFPALQVKADLSVISGDTEGKGLLGRLKELMLDQFFEDECDIVVNTGAMFGGLKRADGGRFHLDMGPEVNHFSYFRNDETVRMLTAGLLRADGSDAGFSPLVAAPEKEPARAPRRRAAAGALPVVFVLPGIMGSTLEVGKDRIWLDKLDIMTGKFGKLAVDRQVVPVEPFRDYYSDLIDHLADTHEVVPFPYDWRRSILDAGDALGNSIAARLNELERLKSRQPVRILAHSMGGLVARAMIARKPEVWRRMTAHEGSRLVMLGTPNGGSHEIVRFLTGYSSTLQQLALLDFTRNWKELLDIIVRFPGVLELLPIDDNFRYFRQEIWQELKGKDTDMREFRVPLPAVADLQQAVTAWQTIMAAGIDTGRTLYVAGQARQTPVGWRAEVREDPLGISPDKEIIVFEATGRGDGKVPWDTGIPAGVRTWYLEDVEHGDLPAHEPAFPAYVELLQSGNTNRLAATPPVGARAMAVEQRTDLAVEVPAVIPEEGELMGSLLGGGRRRKKARVVLPKVEVSITHGDLAYARYPVCVGHYAGDTIVSAEDYLDRALGGRLRERLRLGLYPGPLGSCEVLLNPDRCGKPAGAIVIGLGRVGELGPGNLEQAVASAALQYALKVAECQDDRFGDTPGVPRSAKMTSLLVGTGAGGMSTRDSIEAILRGVAAANRRLREQELSRKVWIDAVEFTELWQDMAIQAAAELERALMDGRLADGFAWKDRTVRDGEGRRKRVQFDEAADWWHRLEIVHDRKKDELRFISLTDKARAEESLVTGQLRLADDFIRDTIADTSRDSKVSHSLFEMLVPNRMKELAPNQYDVVLVVDEVSGSYPWELLEDRWSSGDRPPSVAAGMLRQLKTEVYRERPVTTLQDTAFVVGDPLLTEPEFPSLEGAQKEAAAVADFLHQNGFSVTRQIRADAKSIIAALHDDGYRVLHLAGHGVHEWEVEIETDGSCVTCEQPLPKTVKRVSGMVIGDNTFLTPGDVEQMRWVPELVFINCCHLGSLAAGDKAAPKAYHRLAANIAAQFVRMGVKAVVAAGWAVDDAAAETFAISFYQHLLAGDKFGEAVRAAREETFERHGTTNTWGAYQCYGDPAYRLRSRKDRKKGDIRRNYLSPAQVIMDLENLLSRARMGSGSSAELESIVKAVRDKKESWLALPDVAAAMGVAAGELCLFDQAITHLDRAIAGEKAEFPLRAVEQRANYKSRLAVELSRGGMKGTGASPDTLIKEAIDDIQRLLAFAATAERLSLMGSAFKRHAWITKGNERKEALAGMADYYRQAHEKRYDAKNGRMDTYPLLNWLAAEILLGWYGANTGIKASEIRDWCEKARAFAEERERREPNFWNSVVMPECTLVLALSSNTLEEQKDAVVDGYRHARARGVSAREFQSVVDHLEFLTEMARAAGRRKDVVGLAATLTEIVEQVKAMAPEEEEGS